MYICTAFAMRWSLLKVWGRNAGLPAVCLHLLPLPVADYDAVPAILQMDDKRERFFAVQRAIQEGQQWLDANALQGGPAEQPAAAAAGAAAAGVAATPL